ncbi:MAG: polyprenyl synthetase family protein [Planctomycetia bacterium]|nr:polyprenyl synthetase family protein [Planctomycetia bacterium]
MSVSAVSITETCRSLRERVNARLDKYVEQAPGVPPRLRDAMAYSLLAGGKRLRPILVLLSCEACGGQAESALPAACAIEMVHTYSLIHDDLPAMDNDDLRRGRPTNHVVFGEALAILAGDGLLTLAFQVLASDISPPETAAACCADLAHAAGMAGMVGGQVADLEAEGRAVSTIDELEGIHRRKTGALLASALTLGARVAGAGNDDLHRLASFGRSLGLAFQITDDLLDVCGTSQNMGKAVNKDASRGKLTYPSLLGEDASLLRAQCQIAEASKWIESFGERGRRLEALAQFVLERDH